jgi:hypothetical protein
MKERKKERKYHEGVRGGSVKDICTGGKTCNRI